MPPLNFEKGHIEDAIRKSLTTGKPLLVFSYSINIITKIQELLAEENLRLIVQRVVTLEYRIRVYWAHQEHG